MLKKIGTTLVVIAVITSMYNYVFAKYITNNNIHIAEVNVVKRKRYNFEVVYIDKETNISLNVKMKRLYEGDKYEVEILNFEGYTFLYADKDITGIIENNTKIYCYYQKDNV